MSGTRPTLKRTDSACSASVRSLNDPGRSHNFPGVHYGETWDRLSAKTEVRYWLTDGIATLVRSTTPQTQLWLWLGVWVAVWLTFYHSFTLHFSQVWFIIVDHVTWNVAPKSMEKTGKLIARPFPISLFPTCIDVQSKTKSNSSRFCDFIRQL